MKITLKHRPDRNVIVLSLTHNNQRRFISLGIHCTYEQWSVETYRVKRNFPNYARVNKELEAHLKRSEEIISMLTVKDELSFDAFFREFSRKGISSNIISYQ